MQWFVVAGLLLSDSWQLQYTAIYVYLLGPYSSEWHVVGGAGGGDLPPCTFNVRMRLICVVVAKVLASQGKCQTV